MDFNIKEWTDLDWRTYQKLVAGLHADEETRVETEYEYPIPGSGTKEVDVVVWDQSDHYKYTDLIECKFHDDPISQSVVDSVNGYFQRSDADKAVIVSKSGFQNGAIERAEGTGVELLTIRRFIPGTDISADALRYANVNLNIADRDLDVIDMDTEPLHDDKDGEREEIEVEFNRANSHLYTTDRRPTSETLLDRLVDLKQSKECGKHTEQFDDTALLVRGDFYQLHSIDYQVTETTSSTEFTVDLFEDVDLLYRDELTGEREYKSLSDALGAFRKHIVDES